MHGKPLACLHSLSVGIEKELGGMLRLCARLFYGFVPMRGWAPARAAQRHERILVEVERQMDLLRAQALPFFPYHLCWVTWVRLH